MAQCVHAEIIEKHPYVWKSVAIHGGGFVAGIITDPSGAIYARTDVGGGYRWDGERKCWLPLTDWISRSDWSLMGCESLAIDPAQTNRIYMALGMYTNDWSPSNGAIVRSADGGKSFERIDMPFKMGGNCPGRSVGERLAVDPNDGRVLFFGSRAAGLWRTADSAKTWAKVNSFSAAATAAESSENNAGEWPIGISFVRFDRASGHRGSPTPVIYAGICTKKVCLFRSSDGGATWQPVHGQPVGFRPNHMARASNNVYYLSYSDEAGPNGMENGAVWALNPNGDQWANITPVKPSGSDKFGYGAVTVDARHPQTIMACSMDRWNQGDTIFRSNNGGKSWNSETVGGKIDKNKLSADDAPWAMSIAPHWLGDIEIDPADSDHVFFVTGFGVWASHDATTLDVGRSPHWSFEDAGLEETVPLALVSPTVGPHLISVIGDFDGFTHSDLNASPRIGRHTPIVGSSSGLDFAGQLPNRVVRAGGKDRGFLSDDGGQTWNEFAAHPRGKGDGGTIAISSDGRTILWQPGSRETERSTDFGKSWTACRGLPSALAPVADRVDPNRFYCLDSKSGSLYVSSDAGNSFRQAAQGLPGGAASLQAVDQRAGDIWFSSGDALWHSFNAGQSFSKINSLKNTQRFGFGKAARTHGYPAIFATGTLNQIEGLFRSDDAGQSWVRIDDDMHRYGGLNVVIGDPREFGRVYIATTGRGIIYGDLQ